MQAEHHSQPPHAPYNDYNRYSTANSSEEQYPYLDAPQAPFRSAGGTQTPTVGESVPPSPNQSSFLLPIVNKQEGVGAGYAYGADADVDVDMHDGLRSTTNKKGKKGKGPLLWVLMIGGVLIVAAAAVVPVYFLVIKPKHSQTAANGSTAGSSGGGNSSTPTSSSGSRLATTGGDGSTVTSSDGSSFVYKNQFGGFWVADPNDPYSDNARPNSWTPPLNTSWTFGKDQINGVNLGGWFVLEPFISPALFQKYPAAVDEWTLSQAMAADTSEGGGLGQLEDHYNTFITEQDIAEIAGAGLNWVRVPIPFWAIETWPGEPFLAKTSWKYIVRLFEWCKKYGIRVNLDLHTVPGSQNGYNHSGKLGSINWLNGPMGLANAQRTLNYIRTITEFISQPQWKNVVGIFSIVNEAYMKTIGQDALTSFYIEAHNIIRSITGTGAGNGPYISIHDGFQLPNWAGFLPGADRLVLDDHAYFAFDEQPNTEPIATGLGDDAGGKWPAQACSAWGPELRKSQSDFGVTIVGEFSNGYNSCGLYVLGFNGVSGYGDCSLWMDSTNWNDTVKAGLQAFAEASMDSLGEWFFWTWKIGNSTKGIVEAPLWSYKLGLENGWMPASPKNAQGRCSKLGVNIPAFDGNYSPAATGGQGAGSIVPSATQNHPWPPPTLSGLATGVAMAQLPTYTPTGTMVTLQVPTPTVTADGGKTIDSGNGWFNAQDTAPAYTAVATCQYPDPWDAVSASVPIVCGGAAATPTPPPRLRLRR